MYYITYRIDKTNALNLSRLIPAHWKKALKPAFSAGSYQTTVFEVSDIDKITIPKYCC
jgi:hypothetical protein